MTRIGFYPGTFDPLHEGHIAFMNKAALQVGLDSIHIMPEPLPRYKPQVSHISERTGHIRRIIATSPNIHLMLPGMDQFTVNLTLPAMSSIAFSSEKYLLIGSDTLLGIHKWNDIGTLLQSFNLIVGIRFRQTDSEVAAALNYLNKLYEFDYHIIKTDYGHISSTDIRKQKKTLSI